MKTSFVSYKIASWTLLLGGILHSLADLLSPETPAKNEIILQMKAFTGQVLGTQFNLWFFHQGFSLMMGLLLVGYGALNLLILKNNQQAALPSNVLILNIVVSLLSVIIAIKYFFIIPVILTGIPLLGFLISFITKNKK